MTVFEFVLSAIPVALLFSVALAYIISAYWREDSKALAKEANRYLRDQQSQIRAGTARLDTYKTSQFSQPYATDYENAAHSLTAASSQLTKNYHTYAQLRNQIEMQLQKTPRNLLLRPYLWFETRRSFFRFRHDIEKAKLHIIELNQHNEKLNLCESRTMAAAQQTWSEFESLSELIQSLSHQIHGEKFSQNVSEFEKIRAELIIIPPHFLDTSPNEEGSSPITQSEIIQVHQILQTQNPILRALQRTNENWETQIQLIEDELIKLKRKHQTILSEINQLPIGINPDPLLDQLNSLKEQIQAIRENSRRSEPEELRHFLREIRQTDRILDELDQQANEILQAFKVYNELRKTLQFLWQKLKNLAYKLHGSPFLPISFGESTKKLNQIGAQFSSLTKNTEPSEPEKIITDSVTMQSVVDDCETLLPQLEALQAGHAQLIILLRRLTSKDMDTWLEEMNQILMETQIIPSQNYHHLPAANGLELPAALREIQIAAQSKLPTLNMPIKEEAVFSTLTEAKRLEDLRNLINDTLQSQKNQFRALMEKEETCQEKTLQIQRSLERVEGILLGDPNLNQNFRKDIRRAIKQHRELEQQLKDPSKTTVETKYAQVDSLYQEQYQMLTTWVRDLSQKNSQDAKALQNSFEELHAAAKIADAAINQVDIFLQQKATMRDVEDTLIGLDLLDLVDYLETIDQIQREMEENQKILKDTLSQVNHAVDQMKQKNDTCRNKMSEAEQWISPDGWNQRALGFDRIRKDFEALQGALERFSKETNPVRQYLAKSENFCQQLTSIETRFDTIIEESRLEDEQISNTRTAFEMTANLWENIAGRLQQDRTANSEIRSMLQEYNQKAQNLHRRYESGNLKINDYTNHIKRLDRDLNNETVETANKKFIDINGQEFK